jgi:hypothetical protein
VGEGSFKLESILGSTAPGSGERRQEQVRRAHEECAAIISDMRALSAANTPSWSKAKRNYKRATGGISSSSNINNATMSSTAQTLLSLPSLAEHSVLPNAGVLDAAGSSLAAAAFGTPPTSGGISGGLNDICMALWSAAPLQQHTKEFSFQEQNAASSGATNTFARAPPRELSESAPHPSMYSKYRKLAPTKLQHTPAKSSSSSSCQDVDLEGETLNMDVAEQQLEGEHDDSLSSSHSPYQDDHIISGSECGGDGVHGSHPVEGEDESLQRLHTNETFSHAGLCL